MKKEDTTPTMASMTMAARLLRPLLRRRTSRRCGTLVINDVVAGRPGIRRRFAGQCVSNVPPAGDEKNNHRNVPFPRSSVDRNVEESSKSSKKDNNSSTTTWRPMTIVERIACFPDAARKVWADYLLNQNIQDASTTPLNAWTVNHPLIRKRPDCHNKEKSIRHSCPDTFHDDITVKEAVEMSSEQATIGRQTTTTPATTRIPWRQVQQQRRIQQELRFILPIVALSMPPGIGYITMLLAFAAPRQVLTRHFFNEYETQHFARLEYEQRLQEYEPLVTRCLFLIAGTSSVRQEKDDWKDYLKSFNHVIYQQHDQAVQWDAAGPIVDAFPLYLGFFASTTDASLDHATTSTSHRGGGGGGAMSSTLFYSREHLSRLAMAAGAVYPSLPAWMSRLLCDTVVPTSWLCHRTRHRARMVVEDDDNLLLWISQQKEDNNNNNNNLEPCWSLTDLEVRDACLLRGLPVELTATATATTNTNTKITNSSFSRRRFIDVHDMRKCLVNHLNMIASVKQRLPVQEHDTEGFGLFMLHLPIIRHFLIMPRNL
jgi:hypothetical protein